MSNFWKSLSYTTKFSIIGFIIIFILGFLSMGALGAVLYYPVSFLFSSYPTLNDWTGDWVWPAVIMVGILWSIGFLLAGFLWHYQKRWLKSIQLLRLQYVLVLWLWSVLLWYVVISNQYELV
ncbi:hypothetical protein ACE939_08290 [Aquimarina sp. W85]|uniref:hypothetical protein n=1 Tax=Aquimarina rhodophyticola TaxID=3342246 RepID=UPI00366CCABE